jgi:hypothetical protein
MLPAVLFFFQTHSKLAINTLQLTAADETTSINKVFPAPLQTVTQELRLMYAATAAFTN